jgi:hypothetical protein
LTKIYGIRLVTSQVTLQKMINKELKGSPFPYPTRELDHVKVVGRTLPVEIYDVMEPHSPGIPIREEYDKAFKAYLNKDFDTATKIWKECVSLMNHRRLYWRFCRKYCSRRSQIVCYNIATESPIQSRC